MWTQFYDKGKVGTEKQSFTLNLSNIIITCKLKEKKKLSIVKSIIIYHKHIHGMYAMIAKELLINPQT